MPETHFVGEISHVIAPAGAISVTWAIVPGNSAWTLRNGISFGETQAGYINETNCTSVINHPIDIQFEVSSSEGWPLFVCEIWDKSHDNGVRGFLGCGCSWLPLSGSSNGKLSAQQLEITMWRPCSSGLESLSDIMLPTCPDLKAIRELTVSPYLRSQIKTELVGTVFVQMYVVSAGLEQFGVQC